MGKKSKRSGDASGGAALLDAVVRLNRWANHHSVASLPLAQARVLSQIDEWGQARTGDLARAERCSQPTMTARVQRLQAQGWVQRVADPLDARAATLTLTDEGRAVLASARGTRARVIDALIAQLDAPERQRLQEAIQALRGLLDAAYADLPEHHHTP